MEQVPVTKRAQWKSSWGFLMAAVGAAVGLGNLYRFPFLVGSCGGASFVLLYLVLLVLVGIPLVLTEIALGQYGKTDIYGTYVKVHPRFGIIGRMGVFCGFIVLSCYACVGGWTLYYMGLYLISLFTGRGIPQGETTQVFSSLIAHPWLPVVLEWLFLGFAIGVMLFGLKNGTELANKIMIPMLFFIMLFLACVSLSLKGSFAGVVYYLKPRLDKLSFSVAHEALGQVFFSLSLGMGGIVTYGSYLTVPHSSKKSAIVIAFCDTLIALIAGLVIFPAVFATGLSPKEGIGLLFITLPQVFQRLPLGNYLACAFFICTFVAALTSTLGMMEVVVAYWVDQKHSSRSHAIIFIGIIGGILGIFPALANGQGVLAQVTISSLCHNPTWMSKIPLCRLSAFAFLDTLAAKICLPIGGIAICLAAGWVLGKNKLLAIITHNGRFPFRLGSVYFFLLKYLIPLAILIIFLHGIFS